MDMGEVKAFRCNGADTPGIGITIRIVQGLRGYSLGVDILLIKESLKVILYLVYGEHPFPEQRQNGDQHIGGVLDLVHVAVMLIIVVGGLGGVQLLS